MHSQDPIAQLITCGAVTPLGLDIDSTAAALRAQLSASAESENFDKSGEPSLFVFVEPLNTSKTGMDRMIELGGVALLQVLGKIETLKLEYDQIPIFWGLPEPRPGIEKIYTFLDQFAEFFDIKSKPAHWQAFHDGHAAGLLGLSAAIEFITSGKADLCIVGGVDSYWHPETLAWLDRAGRLKSDVNLDGFIPGEAAAFVLVASNRAVNSFGLASQAELLKVADAVEPYPFTSQGICIGQGLTAVLHGVLDLGTGTAPIADWVICDLNGESYRASEWGYAYLRSGDLHRDPLEIWHPADSIGDIGAASGAMFVSLAMNALMHKFGRGSRPLIWTSADHGPRSAALLRAASAKIK